MAKKNRIQEIKILAEEFLKEFDAKANIEVSEVENEENCTVIKVNVDGDNLGEFIGYQGKNLESLQHLVNLAFNNEDDERVKIVIDINGYRKKREEYLMSVAQRAMADAVESRQPIYLPPMKAYERRVIHMVLKNEEAVTTSSEGEEPERYIIITPN